MQVLLRTAEVSAKCAFVLSDCLIGDDMNDVDPTMNTTLFGDANAGKRENDDQVNIATVSMERSDAGWVYVKQPPVKELHELLRTEEWRIETDTDDPFEKLDVERSQGIKEATSMGTMDENRRAE